MLTLGDDELVRQSEGDVESEGAAVLLAAVAVRTTTVGDMDDVVDGVYDDETLAVGDDVAERDAMERVADEDMETESEGLTEFVAVEE